MNSYDRTTRDIPTKKTGKAVWPSPFSRRNGESGRKKLETEAQTKLHRSR